MGAGLPNHSKPSDGPDPKRLPRGTRAAIGMLVQGIAPYAIRNAIDAQYAS